MIGVPDLPYRATMPEIVRRAASIFGDADYIVMLDRRISFREAEAASRRLAKQLLAAGVTKGARIGIHLVTGPEWAVAFLAVTRIGAVAMPFSTIYRPAELRTAMRTGDVSVLLSSPTMLGKDHEAFLEDALPGLARALPGRLRIAEVPYLRSIWLLGHSSCGWAKRFEICSDDAGEAVDGFDEAFLEAVEAEVTPADVLTVVFTSGTTAAPKAVVHTHGAVLRKTAPASNAALNAIFGGRVLSLMPFFWIGGMQEVLAALQSGATLLALERLSASAALELGKREQATSLMGNPQALRSMLGRTAIEEAIPTLRPLPRRPWEGGPSRHADTATGIGMTETFGPWTAVEGFECRVVDTDTGEVMDEGQTGEFQVRGYGLMQGLYKREREEVFTADGFYRTGDLGYVDGGLFYFTARLKDMIKTKGANVAPAEVEAVLNANPRVRTSFVAGLPHDTFGEEVVAGVVAEEGHTIDVAALLAECRRVLSPYKVPTMIAVLRGEAIPQLANGKPDRRAVAAMLAEHRRAAMA